MGANPETTQRVIAILAAQALCDPADLTPQTRIETLGIDSMGLAEILFAIEEDFDVAVPFNANTPDAGGMDLTTVETVCDAVQRLLDGPQA